MLFFFFPLSVTLDAHNEREPAPRHVLMENIDERPDLRHSNLPEFKRYFSCGV